MDVIPNIRFAINFSMLEKIIKKSGGDQLLVPYFTMICSNVLFIIYYNKMVVLGRLDY